MQRSNTSTHEENAKRYGLRKARSIDLIEKVRTDLFLQHIEQVAGSDPDIINDLIDPCQASCAANERDARN